MGPAIAVPSIARPLESATTPVPALSELYAAHAAFVWRSARRLLGLDSDVVDDIVQEVFLVALRRLPEFEGRSTLRTWLYAILRNVVSDHRRLQHTRVRDKRRDSVDLDTIETRESGQHRKVEKAEALRALHEVLDQIDEERREVFVLSELEQMSAPEIAEITGTNITTVHARLRDARKRFEVLVRRYRARNGEATS